MPQNPTHCDGCPAKSGNSCRLFEFENAVIACPDFTLAYYYDEFEGEKLELMRKVLEYRGLKEILEGKLYL